MIVPCCMRSCSGAPVPAKRLRRSSSRAVRAASKCPERSLVDAVDAVAGGGARQPGASPGSWLGGRPWRADCLALLATWGRHRTHCTRCARSVQTCGAKSEVEARCARAPSRCAAQPATRRGRPSLGTNSPQDCLCPGSAPHKSPSNAPGYRALASRRNGLHHRAKRPTRLGSARRRAICDRPRAQRSGSGARSAHQLLTWRHLFERSEHCSRSEFAAADPRSEHRGQSARQSRPGHHEPGGGPSPSARKSCPAMSAPGISLAPWACGLTSRMGRELPFTRSIDRVEVVHPEQRDAVGLAFVFVPISVGTLPDGIKTSERGVSILSGFQKPPRGDI